MIMDWCEQPQSSSLRNVDPKTCTMAPRTLTDDEQAEETAKQLEMARSGGSSSAQTSSGSFSAGRRRSSLTRRWSSATSIASGQTRSSSIRASRRMSYRGSRRMSLSTLSKESLRDLAELAKKDRYEECIDQFFNQISVNADEYLQHEDLFTFLKDATVRMNIGLSDDVIHMAVDALIEDVTGSKMAEGITRDHFFEIFRRHPEMLKAFEAQLPVTDDQGVGQGLDESAAFQAGEDQQFWEHNRASFRRRLRHRYGLSPTTVWLILYCAATIAVFVEAAHRWAMNEEAVEAMGYCIVVARASAATLNLHAMLILLPMCRHLNTYLRSTKLRFLFPFDFALEAHMLIGTMFAILVTSHVTSHICDYVRLASVPNEFLLIQHGFIGNYPANSWERWCALLVQPATITGLLMVICMVVAYSVLMQRRTNFNRFWYLHHLLILMIILMCIHGTGNLFQPYQTIYWVMVPLALYILPRIYREVRCKPMEIQAINIYDNVLGLQLAKPQSWEWSFRAGMYAFVNIPEISRMEWHPFTMSSSPAQDCIEFHIMTAGDWTKKAHKLMEDHRKDCLLSVDQEIASPVVRVEGPMGASSQGFRDYKVVVLIGAGIGITPMISVLRDLLHNPGKMKKTFFYWTVRELSSFDWFESLMEEIFESDKDGVLEVQHFLTTVKSDQHDLGSLIFHYAAAAVHRQSKLDIVLGHHSSSRVKTMRPSWDTELQRVIDTTMGLGGHHAGVFLCGPEKLSQDVANVCKRLSSARCTLHFTKETF